MIEPDPALPKSDFSGSANEILLGSSAPFRVGNSRAGLMGANAKGVEIALFTNPLTGENSRKAFVNFGEVVELGGLHWRLLSVADAPMTPEYEQGMPGSWHTVAKLVRVATGA